jgi:hypothetical protein
MGSVTVNHPSAAPSSGLTLSTARSAAVLAFVTVNVTSP